MNIFRCKHINIETKAHNLTNKGIYTLIRPNTHIKRNKQGYKYTDIQTKMEKYRGTNTHEQNNKYIYKYIYISIDKYIYTNILLNKDKYTQIHNNLLSYTPLSSNIQIYIHSSIQT